MSQGIASLIHILTEKGWISLGLLILGFLFWKVLSQWKFAGVGLTTIAIGVLAFLALKGCASPSDVVSHLPFGGAFEAGTHAVDARETQADQNFWTCLQSKHVSGLASLSPSGPSDTLQGQICRNVDNGDCANYMQCEDKYEFQTVASPAH
jgi:hypothetical protein